jgi:hypothetical protein
MGNAAATPPDSPLQEEALHELRTTRCAILATATGPSSGSMAGGLAPHGRGCPTQSRLAVCGGRRGAPAWPDDRSWGGVPAAPADRRNSLRGGPSCSSQPAAVSRGASGRHGPGGAPFGRPPGGRTACQLLPRSVPREAQARHGQSHPAPGALEGLDLAPVWTPPTARSTRAQGSPRAVGRPPAPPGAGYREGRAPVGDARGVAPPPAARAAPASDARRRGGASGRPCAA